MPSHIYTLLTTPVLLSGLLLGGCQTTQGNSAIEKGVLGAAAGAIVGAIIGNNAGDGDAQSGALIGAVIGGAGGAYAGCRETGGCGASPQHNTKNGSGPYRSEMYEKYRNQTASTSPRYGHSTSTTSKAPLGQTQVDRRQYFDNKTGRYYFYDPVSKREYYENGAPKNR